MADLLQPATTLDDVYKTLSPEPLIDTKEFNSYYVADLNQVRGTDQMRLLGMALERAAKVNWYQGFLMGHPGVGKSTEITRLINKVEGHYLTVRFSATDDLDGAGFKPFDVLLVMLMKVIERTKEETGQTPPDYLLEEVIEWFSKEETIVTTDTNTQLYAGGGVEPTSDSIWAKVSGLFLSLKGEIKYTADRQQKRVEYRINQISSLITLCNKVIFECNDILKNEKQRQWLFVGEEFDKPGIPVAQTENLFINYASIFHNLHAYLIFNIPISLVRSERRAQLPCPEDKIFCIPDTPVYDQEHEAFAPGRDALAKVLDARMAASLFDAGQRERLIVASGGNLRDLFSLVSRAADESILRDETDGLIRQDDATKAINNLRNAYEQSLGSSPYDERKDHEILYDDKAALLVKIYNGDADAKIPNPILYSLLRSRTVQQFNGTVWYGVHPLAVDILHRQGKIDADDGGGVPGGII